MKYNTLFQIPSLNTSKNHIFPLNSVLCMNEYRKKFSIQNLHSKVKLYSVCPCNFFEQKI